LRPPFVSSRSRDRCYPATRSFTAPSESTLIVKDGPVVTICVDRGGVGSDNGPRWHLLTTEITNAVGSSSVKLFRAHKYRKPRPLGLRFRVVLTEGNTERLEWQMACNLKRSEMTSGYTPGSMPEKDQPGFDQILGALRKGLNEDPRLKEMPAEEVARRLVKDGHLEGEPPPPLVAEALEGLEAEEQSFQNDELSSEDANPT
jgi:hypothetical protein